MTVKASRGMDVSQHPRRHKHSHNLIPPASRLEFVRGKQRPYDSV